MHPREIRIIVHITQMIYAIMCRGYVQMTSRDLSMRFKRRLHNAKTSQSCPSRRHRRAVPACPLGRRFHPINVLKLWPFVLRIRNLKRQLIAPTQADAALIAQRIRYLNRPYGRILKRRPEGRRFLGVLFDFLRRLLRQRQSDHKSFAP